jgi:DNA invertase Pin-like site-specific DNA recombinase
VLVGVEDGFLFGSIAILHLPQRHDLLECRQVVAVALGPDVDAADAGISGAKGRDKRPGLDAMLKAVNAKEFDMVAAWSVDRLGRSLTDLLGILQGLHDKGVDLFLHQQGLDTSTTAGKAMFQMLGVFAEFERGIIRERVNAGLARARANGTKLGRRRIDPAVEARILELKASGEGMLKIGRKLGIGTSVVQRVFKQEPLPS